jgi:hypothetical protein
VLADEGMAAVEESEQRGTVVLTARLVPEVLAG